MDQFLDHKGFPRNQVRVWERAGGGRGLDRQMIERWAKGGPVTREGRLWNKHARRELDGAGWSESPKSAGSRS